MFGMFTLSGAILCCGYSFKHIITYYLETEFTNYSSNTEMQVLSKEVGECVSGVVGSGGGGGES